MSNNRFITCITLALGLMVGSALPSYSQTSGQLPGSIRKDHPRLFFNSDTWPEVKANALGPMKGELQHLLDSVNRITDDPHCTGISPDCIKWGPQPDGTYIPKDDAVVTYPREFGTESALAALAWRFTGEEKYLIKAKKLLKESVRGYTEATDMRLPVSWFAMPRINALCAYDWIFEALTDSERREVIVPLVRHCTLVQPEAGLGIPRQPDCEACEGFYNMTPLLWYSGLAAYGDGYCDEEARQQLLEGYERHREMMEYREASAGDDGGLNSCAINYTFGRYPWAHFNFMYTYLSACGENIASSYPNIGLMPNFLWWNWVRDDSDRRQMRYLGVGDNYHGQNSMDMHLFYAHLRNYIHFYKEMQPEACALAETLCGLLPDKVFDFEFPVYPYMVGVDKVEPIPLETLEHSKLHARYFEELGLVSMRSSWTDDATNCIFLGGGRAMHRHYDANSFVIYKHDHLALDTGCRADGTDMNVTYYYCQTVAHNAVLIHKPGEKRPGHFGPAYTDDPAAEENYGGQIEEAAAQMLAFETCDDYSYMACDAADSYGGKCTEGVRQFVYLTPDCFVVYDRVTSSEPSYRKQWLLHTENEPIRRGRTMMADCGKGRMFCETLLPERPVIEKVGGEGREYWVRDRNYPFDPAFLEAEQRTAEESGRGTYFGKWRVEISQPREAADARFLNVISVGDTTMAKPFKTRLLRDRDRDGVQISIDGKKITLWFNRHGKVGGEISVSGSTRALTDKVQEQKGVGLLASCEADAQKKGFEPFVVENLEPRPDFWKVRPQEIIELCENVKVGRSEKIAETPLGFPVYAVFYGDFTEPEPQTNFSAGNSSSTIMSYLGDRYKDPDVKQTIMYLTGVHGSEPEGIAAAANMIQMLETGKDFRGQTDAELLELASKYRIIIIPCLNMDGRSICPDHLRGQPYEVFRKACQGTWKDGSLIGWLGSKEYYPLPLDRVSFPGGYPNGDGYNIQHDCAPGNMKTEEAKAVCRLMARWRVDLLLNVHSCERSSTMFEPGLIDTPAHIQRGNELYTKVLTAYKEAGLRYDVPEIEGGDEAVDLTQLANYCSGALGLTVECSSSYDDIDDPKICYSFDQLMDSAILAFKVIMEDGLREPFNRRIER